MYTTFRMRRKNNLGETRKKKVCFVVCFVLVFIGRTKRREKKCFVVGFHAVGPKVVKYIMVLISFCIIREKRKNQ